MERAMIGVIPLYDFAKSSYWMLPGYLEGLMEAGGLPVVLPLTADGAMLTQIADQCSGFLFTGGQDVTPEIYGAAALPCCGERCPARDEMEQALLPLILERDKPLLGICRGIQILNAALGGTLYQDLPEQHPSEVTHRQAPPYDLPAHEVELTADSRSGSCWERSAWRSTAATIRPSARWLPVCGPWPMPGTDWWRRSVRRTTAGCGRSSGTRNFPSGGMRTAGSCSAPL